MSNFENFKKFWEKEEPEIVTTSNLEGLSKNFYYDKVDLEIIEKVALETFPKIDPYHGLEKPFSITFNEPWVLKEKELVKRPGLTWIDMAEKEYIEDYKQGMIDTILMGDYKKEMKMKINRVELEMQRLREGTGENYMLNKMINTDGVNFFVEYTLYKDYDKYFGLTLDGESINIIDIMEEEFAEFLSHYRVSAMYPQIKAVHEDTSAIYPQVEIVHENTWDITPEENEAIKEQMESGKTDSFVPVYDENDIADELVVDSKYDMTTNSFSETYLKGPEMWTETSTNTRPDCTNSWAETSTNTVVSTNWTSAPQDIKDMEDRSKAELISKIVADVIEELLTKGTCSLNITLGQE